MRAVIYEGAGGPEVITIGEVPKPEVGKDHIRVRVHAAGLNRADLIQRRGQYAAPTDGRRTFRDSSTPVRSRQSVPG
jgi:NADPH2:quinone reductase